MDQKPATIREIAERLNVSVSTVSRALQNHPGIGLHTRMQVKKLAAELHYEPNQPAVSHKKGKSFTIGLIIPNLGEEYFSIAINSIEDAAFKSKYTVLIGHSHDDVDKEKRIVEMMRRHHVDGVIVSITKNTGNVQHFEDLKKHNIPVVFFDRVPESADVYKVLCSLKQSTIEMVDWLVGRSRTRIGFIKGPGAMVASDERLQGYIQGLAKNNLRLDQKLLVETDLTSPKNLEAIKKLLSLEKKPDAIINFNDYVAFDTIKYAREQGIRVNQDIFFTSYANLPISRYLGDHPVLSVEQFPGQQAEKAVDMLLKLIEAKDGPIEIPRKFVIEGKLVEM